MSRLSRDEVALIRASSRRNADLANALGVSHVTIASVRSGRTYAGIAQDVAMCTARDPIDGRGRRGSRNGRAKLDESDIPTIRDASETITALAARYGVTTGTIWQIRNKRIWKHV